MSGVDRVQDADAAASPLISVLVATERGRPRCGACRATRRGEATRVGSPGRVPRRSNWSAPSARPRGQIIHPRVSNASLTQSTPVCSCPRTVLGNAQLECPAPDRPESSSIITGRHLALRNALLRELVAGEHATGSGRPRRCRCGEVPVDPVDGSPLPSGATQRRLAMSADLCGDVAEQGRSGMGTLATIARHSLGAAAATARSRAVPGMSACLGVAHAAGSRAPQTAAAVVATAACGQGQESARVPSQRAGCPGAAQ